MESRSRRFRFVSEIAAGGFGKVYLAEMKSGDNFSTIVAVKVLHGKWVGNDEIVMRSRDEARLLGKLRHRNIVRVEDLTAINGQCAIVMEYLQGVDLKAITQYLKEVGKVFPRQSAFEVIAQIATALDAAYNTVPLQGGAPLNVIHRDIKPSNAMVTVEGDVKVLDFGTARASFEEREAKTQALAFGSAAYMSPERLMGEDDTTSADIFSLGITLYELLTLESYGKIQIRPEKFEASLREKIDAIDLSQLPAADAERTRDALARMLAYEMPQRPTAAEVNDIMEDLAERTRDGGLKRFARDVVRTVYDSHKPPQDPSDPLVGVTIVEERSGFTGAEGYTLEEFAPQASSTHNPVIDFPKSRPETGMAPRVPLGLSTVNPAGTAAPAIDGSGGRPMTMPSPSEPSSMPSPAKTSGNFHEQNEADGAPAKGGGLLKMVVALGIVAVLAVLLVGGGLLVLSSTAGQPADGPTAGVVLSAATLPTGSADMDWGPNAAGKGGVLLSIHEKAVEVNITNSTDFKSDWDGSGFLRLRDLNGGTYRTKVKMATGGAAVRADFPVTLGSTCLFKLDAGAQAWQAGECH
ncbi:MAG: serine/threonine protein kinase [Myxococcales bacterium]|nr:serine/threonine protein kinase [Myxococcales bacterium]